MGNGASYNPHYDNPTDKGCATQVEYIGKRRYEARCWGMKWWNDATKWKSEALGIRANINGKQVLPNDAYKGAENAIYGVFYVDNATCVPYLGTWEKDTSGHSGTCNSQGYREYSAVVYNIPWSNSYNSDTWGTICPTVKANIGGKSYYPDHCVKELTNVWAVYKVPDNSCSQQGTPDNAV